MKMFLIGEDLLKAVFSHVNNPQISSVLPICDALRNLKEHVPAIESAVKDGIKGVETAVNDAVK